MPKRVLQNERRWRPLKRNVSPNSCRSYRRDGLGGAHRLHPQASAARGQNCCRMAAAQAERGNAGLGLVVHYAEAGDLDAAFEHLQRAIDARDPALVHLAVAPQWDSLRPDPRFNQCLVRMKLRPAW